MFKFIASIIVLGLLALIHADPVAVTPAKCGKRNVGGVIEASAATSTHAGESEFGEFPWTVDITKDGNVYCVGSLIHPAVVLTAGQCLIRGDVRKLRIRAGLWDRIAANEKLPHQERRVDTVMVHPQMSLQRYDVGLIFLSEPFSVGPHISTICLPPKSYVVPRGTVCYASGWGRNFLFGGTTQKMKRITLATVDRATCQEKMGIAVAESVLCAGGTNGNDTCTGDSGAPLVSRIKADNEEVYHQIGIASFGASCFTDIPSGYTNVAHVREWIDSGMVAKGFDSSTYED
ncbi:phenoloxidase-activating factor 2-like [Haematobia irritans]|uniref:phenoloxidase-activating factor 2-like n=1 Tax=Haematobia irritans TaxID=7368 RepID=UPI003F50C39C